MVESLVGDKVCAGSPSFSVRSAFVCKHCIVLPAAAIIKQIMPKTGRPHKEEGGGDKKNSLLSNILTSPGIVSLKGHPKKFVVKFKKKKIITTKKPPPP